MDETRSGTHRSRLSAPSIWDASTLGRPRDKCREIDAVSDTHAVMSKSFRAPLPGQSCVLRAQGDRRPRPLRSPTSPFVLLWLAIAFSAVAVADVRRLDEVRGLRGGSTGNAGRQDDSQQPKRRKTGPASTQSGVCPTLPPRKVRQRMEWMLSPTSSDQDPVKRVLPPVQSELAHDSSYSTAQQQDRRLTDQQLRLLQLQYARGEIDHWTFGEKRRRVMDGQGVFDVHLDAVQRASHRPGFSLPSPAHKLYNIEGESEHTDEELEAQMPTRQVLQGRPPHISTHEHLDREAEPAWQIRHPQHSQAGGGGTFSLSKPFSGEMRVVRDVPTARSSLLIEDALLLNEDDDEDEPRHAVEDSEDITRGPGDSVHTPPTQPSLNASGYPREDATVGERSDADEWTADDDGSPARKRHKSGRRRVLASSPADARAAAATGPSLEGDSSEAREQRWRQRIRGGKCRLCGNWVRRCVCAPPRMMRQRRQHDADSDLDLPGPSTDGSGGQSKDSQLLATTESSDIADSGQTPALGAGGSDASSDVGL